MMVRITRRNPDYRRISECDVSVEQVQGNDEVDAEMSFKFHEYAQEDLFGDRNVQKTLESRDVMDQQGRAQKDQQDEDSIPGLEPYTDDSASDSDGDEYAAVESEYSIGDETVRPSPMKMRTRSKATRAYLEPEVPEPPPEAVIPVTTTVVPSLLYKSN